MVFHLEESRSFRKLRRIVLETRNFPGVDRERQHKLNEFYFELYILLSYFGDRCSFEVCLDITET